MANRMRDPLGRRGWMRLEEYFFVNQYAHVVPIVV
jgi:hypothetical protein